MPLPLPSVTAFFLQVMTTLLYRPDITDTPSPTHLHPLIPTHTHSHPLTFNHSHSLPLTLILAISIRRSYFLLVSRHRPRCLSLGSRSSRQHTNHPPCTHPQPYPISDSGPIGSRHRYHSGVIGHTNHYRNCFDHCRESGVSKW